MKDHSLWLLALLLLLLLCWKRIKTWFSGGEPYGGYPSGSQPAGHTTKIGGAQGEISPESILSLVSGTTASSPTAAVGNNQTPSTTTVGSTSTLPGSPGQPNPAYATQSGTVVGTAYHGEGQGPGGGIAPSGQENGGIDVAAFDGGPYDDGTIAWIATFGNGSTGYLYTPVGQHPDINLGGQIVDENGLTWQLNQQGTFVQIH